MKIIIKNIKEFGTVASIGVHQVLETERDIENAYYNANRDNFPTIFFYVSYPTNWMQDVDFRRLINEAKSFDLAD